MDGRGVRELRSDFRDFRLDRIVTFRLTGEPFTNEPGRDLKAYFGNIRTAALWKTSTG